MPLRRAGDVAGIYHKVHLPCDIAWDSTEAGMFVAGHEYPVFDTPIGRVGFQICYDIDFPEGSTALALNGCELLLHPTLGYNFPDEEETVAEARLRTRAVDNSFPLLYSNFGPTPGRSCVIGANGNVLACAGRGVDAMAVADVDLRATRHQDWGSIGYPDHRLVIARKRRPDTYGVLTQRVPPYLNDHPAAPGQRTYEYGDDVGLER
ncbi:MAG: carbon-nitrogen hydrolase family protein [Armatimonadetes bacterium]|nr:carbon-nitrogen hydrolase family protein [Armatimonadota bacterium]